MDSSDQIGIVPPHSTELEMSVVGSIIVRPELFSRIVHRLKPEHFYNVGVMQVYQAAVVLHDAGTPPDAVLVKQELMRRGDWSMANASVTDFLMSCIEAPPIASNVEYYAAQLLELAARRKLLALAQEIESGIDKTSEALVTTVETSLESIAEIRHPMEAAKKKSIATICDEIDAELTATPDYGNRSGFAAIDFTLGGIRAGEFIIIGGRPSSGKTTLALNIADYMAKAGNRIAFVSLETTEKEILKTMLAMNDGMFRYKFQPFWRARVNELDRAANRKAMESIRDLDLIILDDKERYRRAVNIATKVRQLNHIKRLNLLIVDHFHLMHHDYGRKRDDLNMGVTSQIFQNLAKDLQIPIILLTQLNREIEKDSRKPRLSDLRECGKLEEDADAVMFIYRDPKQDNENRRVIDFQKVKLGQCSHFDYELDPHKMRFKDLQETAIMAQEIME